MSQILFLIGARGCGKSTVGGNVARRLQWNFLDTDAVLQQRVGCSIAEMVANEGWEAFRAEESSTLRYCIENAKNTSLVLATGGGIVLAEENRLCMQEHGLVCFLRVPVDILAQRLTKNPHTAQRPSLTGQSVTEEIHTVLQERLPLYQATAHVEVEASLPIAQVTEKIYSAAQTHFKG